MSGKTWNEMCPQLRGVVLQDGHVDPITGPRCLIQMSEGPQRGLYIIAHTDKLLPEGEAVLVDMRTGQQRATVAPTDQQALSGGRAAKPTGANS